MNEAHGASRLVKPVFTRTPGWIETDPLILESTLFIRRDARHNEINLHVSLRAFKSLSSS